MFELEVEEFKSYLVVRKAISDVVEQGDPYNAQRILMEKEKSRLKRDHEAVIRSIRKANGKKGSERILTDETASAVVMRLRGIPLIEQLKKDKDAAELGAFAMTRYSNVFDHNLEVLPFAINFDYTLGLFTPLLVEDALENNEAARFSEVLNRLGLAFPLNRAPDAPKVVLAETPDVSFKGEGAVLERVKSEVDQMGLTDGLGKRHPDYFYVPFITDIVNMGGSHFVQLCQATEKLLGR